MKEREHLKNYEYSQAKAFNQYLEQQPLNIREKILSVILEGLCIEQFDISTVMDVEM